MTDLATERASPPLGAEDGPIVSSALRGRGRRIVTILVGVALALAIVGRISNQTRGARGPDSSSYATSAGGLAALFSLLEGNEIPTARLTTPLDQAWTDGTLRSNDVLVVLDQDLSQSEIDALTSFARTGSRLVAGGRSTNVWLTELMESNMEATPPDGFALRTGPGATGPMSAFVPNSDVRYTIAVGGAAPTVFEGSMPGAIGFGVDAKPFEVVAGSVLGLSDTTVLANAQLAKRDNAAFALALLQPDAGSRVVFAEAGHGFRSGRGAGLAAIPSPVRTMLIGLVLAAVAWMFAVGKRVGEPDLANRPLAPSRFEHVAAVAALASRTRRSSDALPTDALPTGDMPTDQLSTTPTEGN